MRSLIISALSLAIFIFSWQMLLCYSGDQVTAITQDFDQNVLPAIEAQRWEEALDDFERLSETWDSYMKKAHLFLDNGDVNSVDSQFAKTLMYIKAEDLSNSSGELLSLRQQLIFLSENEKTSWKNIL